MEDIRDLRGKYRESLGEYWLRLSRVSAVVAFVLVPAGLTLDFAVYPDKVGSFALLRLLCTTVIGLLFLASYTEIGKEWLRNITFVWLLSVQSMICYMIFLTEGALSPYYAGLNLAILAVGLILPTSVYETIFFAGATLLLYIASVMPLDFHDAEVRVAYNNVYFLLLTSIITSIASFFMDQRRYEEFRLKFELDQRNKELADLDRMKSEFFANVSHELRTPLTLILSPIQDILESQSRISDKVASALGTARNNALRLLKLVNDLLDVIRLEEGKGELERAPVSIDPLVAGICDSMGYLAEIQGIELRSSLNAEGGVVIGDVAALEKVFINLLNNAVKFSEKGGCVSVETRKAEGVITIAVSDRGIGISEEDLPFIFDRFRQADGSATRRFGGTGLGLALVKEIVERHCGTISVDSQVGRGTVMTVALPANDREDEEMEGASDGLAQSIGLQRLHRLAELNSGLTIDDGEQWDVIENDSTKAPGLATVLVVDDEPDMRRYLVSMLRDEYRVFQAADGIDGLRLAQEIMPDAMILDLMLPNLDGLEVCRQLKQSQQTRGIKIILLTARVDEEAKLTALKNGADDFVTKPFSRIEVLSRLANLNETARLERDLEQSNEQLKSALNNLKQTQAQLVQSEKLNALGALAAGLLHEINNPLNYSLTALQLVRADPLVKSNELLGEVCGDIDEGMQRIRTIVSDLRAFAYPSEADKRSRFEFAEALESAQRFTSHELKDVRIVTDLPRRATVLGSKTHVTQVLVNLLLNSVKAIRGVEEDVDGWIRVTAVVRDDRLVVTVGDNGVGMDENTLQHIFDPFFTTRDVGEGMGLGLSICHTIVTNHGGRIVADSTPGKGSELVFDLPLADESQVDTG